MPPDKLLAVSASFRCRTFDPFPVNFSTPRNRVVILPLSTLPALTIKWA